MTFHRYAELDESGASPSPQECHEGWHYCRNMDGLLMQLGETCCECEPQSPVWMARRMQERSVSIVVWTVGHAF